MYIPKKFRQENIEELIAFMRDYSFATLLTTSESGIEANHLPISLIESGETLYLHAHVAKANTVWQSVEQASSALVIFNGPNCYISPNSYPTKKETGKAVPTWNYMVVHVQGKISFIHDNEWLYKALDRLTTEHEYQQPVPWSIKDAPASYIQKMLTAIVGIEIEITSITGKWKLSQNQPEVNQRGVVEALSRSTKEPDNKIASLIEGYIQNSQIVELPHE